MNTNTFTCFPYRLALPNAGNATVRVEQKVNGVYQYITTQQTQTKSGIFELVFTPSNENIRISVSGTSGFALQQISLERDNVDTLVNRYLVSPSDYGEPHLSSVFTSYACSGYRYGFNTQEKVDEISGKGNHYTAPYWEYDPRIVHRWNLDPKPVPYISPYAINQGNPIWFSDPYGDTIRIFGAQKDLSIYSLREDQKLYDMHGNSYVQGTDNFVDGIYNDLQQIYNSGTEGQRLIVELTKEKDVFIQYEKNKSHHNVGTVSFDLNKKKNLPTTSGTLEAQRWIVLAHELAHVEDFLNGTMDNSNWIKGDAAYGLKSISNAEKYATHVENIIRSQAGLPLRTHYGLADDNTPMEESRILDSKNKSKFYKNEEGEPYDYQRSK